VKVKLAAGGGVEGQPLMALIPLNSYRNGEITQYVALCASRRRENKERKRLYHFSYDRKEKKRENQDAQNTLSSHFWRGPKRQKKKSIFDNTSGLNMKFKRSWGEKSVV